MTGADLAARSEDLEPNEQDTGTAAASRRRPQSWLTRIPLGRQRRASGRDGGTEIPSPDRAQLAAVRKIGWALFGIQLVALFVYSFVEFNRWAVTRDYGFYARSLYMLAHLHIPAGFFTNHAELTFTLLAPTYWLWPHGPVLLLEQDIAIVAGELVAFLWLCDVVSARRFDSSRMAQLIAVAGLVTLIADPWIWWTAAFDFHFETFGALFAILTARDLYNGRRRWWLWGALTLLSGDVAATYLAAVAFGALVRARRWLWAVAAAAAAFGWIGLLHLVGAMKGSESSVPLSVPNGPVTAQNGGPSVSALGQLLLTLFEHPRQFISILWSQRREDWANLAPVGLLGIVAPFVLFVPLVVLIENSVYGTSFTRPGFQSIPIYLFLPVGTVLVLTWLGRRFARVAVVAALVIIVDAVAWGAIWLPQTPAQWIRVPVASATQISKFAAHVPDSDEVIASQGIEGRFASRQVYVGISFLLRFFPLDSHHVWVVVTPNLSTETTPAANQNALIAELTASPQAKPIVAADGVWGYEYTRAPGQQFLRMAKQLPSSLPAWLFKSTTGRISTSGPSSTWRVVGKGRRGYLTWGDYWTEPLGPAVATAVVSGKGPISVEVWDVTTDTLLARRLATLHGPRVRVKMPFQVPPVSPAVPAFQGWGPFRSPVQPPVADQLEVRVYTPGPAARVDAYSVGMYHR